MRKSRFTPEYARFLARLKAVRTRKGLTQVELADRLGVPQQYISRFENGETRMDVVQLFHYCRAAGTGFSTVCRDIERDMRQES